MRSLTVAFYVAMFLLVSYVQGDVHAYLDPGTGSMALQMLMAGIVGGLSLAKLYWRQIKGFVQRRNVRETSLDD